MRSAAGPSSRTAIVQAALACANEAGWDATSMQAVRQRAGVSNGTLFHHFPTRADLAAAVVGEGGWAEHQEELLGELRVAETAADGVRTVVVRHLHWIEEHPQLARLLLTGPPEVLRQALAPSALTENRAQLSEVAEWLRAAGWSGTPDLQVLLALWLGPAHACARGWLTVPQVQLAEAAAPLAAGAWRSLAPLLQAGGS